MRRFAELLTYNTKLIGNRLIVIDETDTSKVCSLCGPKKNLSARIYHCEICGTVVAREKNSAANLLTRFLSQHAL